MPSVLAGGEEGEGDTGWVPTFTMNRLAGAASSFTPAASPWGNRSPPHGLDGGIHVPDAELGAIHNDNPRAASAQIHQVWSR